MRNQWLETEQFLIAYLATAVLDTVASVVSPGWAYCIAFYALLYIIVSQG